MIYFTDKILVKSRSKGGECQGFCDERTKTLVINWGGRSRSQIVQNCGMSFMNDPNENA